MRITNASLLFIVIAAIAIGCKSTSTEPVPVSPVRNPGEFGYSMNGESFDRKNYHAFGIASIQPSNPYIGPVGAPGQKVLQIPLNIIDTLNQGLIIVIPITTPLTTSFSFTAGTNGAFAWFSRPNTFTYETNGTGSLTITKFDTVNNLVSGTFNFDATLTYPNTDPSKFIHITSGYFNDIPIDIGSYGQGTISAMIDGQPFSTASGSYSASIRAEGDFNNIGITAWDGIQNAVSTMGFNIWSFKPGVYALNNGLIGSGVAAGYNDSSSNDVGISSTKNTATGSFTLTKIDTVNHRLSGTFDFSGFDSTHGKTVHVSNGVIDNVRWVNQ
jgi:hypothetical protein